MKISKEELLKKLEIAFPCTVEKSPIPQMTMFTFSGTDLMCFNNTVVCGIPFESDFTGMIGARDFYDLIRTAPCEEITITGEQDRIRLKGTGLKAFLMYQSIGTEKPVDFDELFSEFPKKMAKIPEDLVTALEFCKWAATEKDTMGIFACIQVDGKDVKSGDSFRFSIYELKSEQFAPFILPSITVPIIQAIEPSKMALSEKFIWFQNADDVVIGIRASTGTYPDVRSLIKKVGKKGSKITLPESLKEVLEAMKMFLNTSESSFRFAVLKAEKGMLTVTARRDAGELVRTLKVEKDVEFQFSINVEYLMDIISHSYTLTLDEAKTMALFTGENFYHIVALIRDVS